MLIAGMLPPASLIRLTIPIAMLVLARANSMRSFPEGRPASRRGAPCAAYACRSRVLLASYRTNSTNASACLLR